jgi:hypothetical protein
MKRRINTLEGRRNGGPLIIGTGCAVRKSKADALSKSCRIGDAAAGEGFRPQAEFDFRPGKSSGGAVLDDDPLVAS